MLDAVLSLLRCPFCGGELARAGETARCPRGHSFDVARQGYLSLLAGDARLGTADSAEMVAARERFLAAGHFDPLADALAARCERALGHGPDGCVLDLGAGSGNYLACVLDAAPGRTGVALDLSKHALRRAARAHVRIGAVAADAWRPLPLRDGVCALVLSVFAPRDAAEVARVLAAGGALVIVTPGADHLGGLVGPLGLLGVDERKPERLAASLAPHLAPVDAVELAWTMELDHAGAADAALMGPSAHHLDPAALNAAVAALPEPVRVQGSVSIGLHRAGELPSES